MVEDLFDWPQIEAIDGWLTEDEAKLLYDLARECPKDRVCVEIGSYKGKSTVAMLQSEARVIAIDWFQGSPEHPEGTNTYRDFAKNTERYGEQLTTLAYKSTDDFPQFIVGNDVHLLFIDGEHSYGAVKKDYELYEPKVVEGGYIVFHDAQPPHPSHANPWPEVTKFVEELIAQGKEPIMRIGRCAVFKK
jgi:predicted O-methyltransferase YrrM